MILTAVHTERVELLEQHALLPEDNHSVSLCYVVLCDLTNYVVQKCGSLVNKNDCRTCNYTADACACRIHPRHDPMDDFEMKLMRYHSERRKNKSFSRSRSRSK